MPLILGANSLAGGGYEIDNSLRFNAGSSDYLSRTFGTPTDAEKWTWSCWIKRSTLGATQTLFSYDSGGNLQEFIGFNSTDSFRWYHRTSGGTTYYLNTNRLFRDVSAWYNILVVYDSSQGTASNRVKFFVNGTQETSFETSNYPAQDVDSELNKANAIRLYSWNGSEYFNGYIAENVFCDGQALAPSDFGEFDEDSGIWKPIAYEGTYGTNGYFLEFKDSSALGDDTSGNTNDWTVNNLTSIDQTTDTPTNNFATMNPLTSHGTVTLAEGNTQVNVADNTDNSTSTFMISSGKWYWEGKYTVGTLAMVGIRPEGMNYNQSNIFNLTGTYQGYYYYADSGNQRPANTAYGDTFATGNIIGVALDLDNNKLYFSKNGVFQNSGDPTSGATGTGAISIATSGLTWGFSFTSGGGSDTFQMNFGNPPFAITTGNEDANGYGNFEYAVPSGYYALNTKNLAEYG
jgi:hypothetical protein